MQKKIIKIYLLYLLLKKPVYLYRNCGKKEHVNIELMIRFN